MKKSFLPLILVAAAAALSVVSQAGTVTFAEFDGQPNNAAIPTPPEGLPAGVTAVWTGLLLHTLAGDTPMSVFPAGDVAGADDATVSFSAPVVVSSINVLDTDWGSPVTIIGRRQGLEVWKYVSPGDHDWEKITTGAGKEIDKLVFEGQWNHYDDLEIEAAPDTDNDGYSDGDEIASGHDPNDPNDNPTAQAIADSIAEFTTTGTQGENGWYYGYRNVTRDGGGENYDPVAAFIEFPPEAWTGQWDLTTAASAPWTELGRDNTHPNAGSGDTHWTVRRWVADELTQVTPLAIRWHTHHANVACGGNGVTGALYRNGQLQDKAVVAGPDNVGVTHTYYLNVNPGDRLDLILSAKGTDGVETDGCDGSVNWFLVDPTIPENPRQPDGSVFIPAGTGDTDGDGIPDFWEKIHFPGDLTKLTATGDFDGDGLKDPAEYQRDSDPTKPDTDGDGLGDLVETGTGIYVSTTDTGSNPRKPDTDGDGLTDSQEVQRTPPTNPNKVDSDTDTFSDPDEIAAGTDPLNPLDNPLTFVIANSEAEFSGVQGQAGWFNGYRNLTQDGKGVDYDPTTDFIPYTGGEGQGPWDGVSQQWTGDAWDLNTAAAGPWTYQARTSLHPNGVNSPPNEEHWAIRRWVADELTKETPVGLIWQVRKENRNGSGVTGTLHINGKQVDLKTIAGNDGVGQVRRFYANLKPGDKVDLGLTPQGIGDNGDGADGSFSWFWVDTRLPKEPRQPDGTLFIPANAPDTDADGLPDFWELIYAANLGVLTGNGDNDQDGLTNSAEFQRDSNPLVADTDGDGLPDAVETNTGIYVSATDTGTKPRQADTDGDGRTDGDEVNVAPTTNPTKADTDGDGFSDGSELATGHNPNDPNHNPLTTLLANSSADFSDTQGQDNWYYGYRNYSLDGPADNYNPDTGLILFDAGMWTGTQWDLDPGGAAPWTELGRENTHPNGNNSGEVHWTIRRWIANEITKLTPMALRWHTRKGNTGGGNGVTGGVYLNGQGLDRATIAGTDGTGVTRTYYANIRPGDRIDLILSPRGTDASDADGSDGSINWLQIDTALPPNPRQPDGTPFVPGGQEEKPRLLLPVFDRVQGRVTLVWSSLTGVTYTIEASANLTSWTKIKTGLASGGEQTSFAATLPSPGSKYQFYRVIRE